jgi:hypothetical protein
MRLANSWPLKVAYQLPAKRFEYQPQFNLASSSLRILPNNFARKNHSHFWEFELAGNASDQQLS